ncbi:MAG: LuxR C-terminal-related transcriptional regulator [Leisingera sp.]
MLQYSRYAVPHYFIHDNVRDSEISVYLSGAYRFDPFFRHWRETGQSGLLSLASLAEASSRVKESLEDYVASFQPRTGMADEIALICPKIGGHADNYFFLRHEQFTGEELALLEALFPTLHALHKRNQELVMGQLEDGSSLETGFPEADAFLIEDSGGKTAFANANWTALAGQDLAVSEAVEEARRVPGRPVAAGHAQILCEMLDEEFALAPGGRITFLIRRPAAQASLDFETVLQQLFRDRLTDRETSICGLILRGQPTANVAETLGISTGTVKNHRKRIYRKLDITTERELFLMLLNHIGSPAS